MATLCVVSVCPINVFNSIAQQNYSIVNALRANYIWPNWCRICSLRRHVHGLVHAPNTSRLSLAPTLWRPIANAYLYNVALSPPWASWFGAHKSRSNLCDRNIVFQFELRVEASVDAFHSTIYGTPRTICVFQAATPNRGQPVVRVLTISNCVRTNHSKLTEWHFRTPFWILIEKSTLWVASSRRERGIN